MTPAVAVLPYAEGMPEGLRALPLDRLSWPLGRPDRLIQGTVADMGASDHLITFPKTRLYFGPRIAAKLSMMIIEPNTVHGKHLRLARLFHRRFHRILTKDVGLLDRLPNARKLVHGTTQVENPEAVDRTKQAMCSLIASNRGHLEGHRLRHALVEHVRAKGLDVAIMGRGYKPFGPKEEGLAPYRYSVVIENTSEPGYFTEKIVDACLCGTVPIYWGAPDIAEYLDAGGIMTCRSEADLRTALMQMSEADFHARADAIAGNMKRATEYADLEGRAARAVLAGQPGA